MNGMTDAGHVVKGDRIRFAEDTPNKGRRVTKVERCSKRENVHLLCDTGDYCIPRAAFVVRVS